MTSLEFPPTYILKTRFDTNEEQIELHRIEDSIKPNLRFNIKEAKLVLGKVNRKERAKHDLRSLGLVTEEYVGTQIASHDYAGPVMSPGDILEETGQITQSVDDASDSETASDRSVAGSNPRKRKRGSSRLSKTSTDNQLNTRPSKSEAISPDGQVIVLNIKWYYESVKAGELLPVQGPYLVYHGVVTTPLPLIEKKPIQVNFSSLMARAKADDVPPPSQRKYGQYHQRSQPSQGSSRNKQSQLIHETTEDHEAAESMPPIPDSLKTRWACQRVTPAKCPNDDFINQLKIIRHSRELESNEVHHDFSTKAYSAGIAVVQAYPYRIHSMAEILRLPGVGEKMAGDWLEFHETGEIQEVKEIQANERMQALDIFWNIFQVADATARRFYDQYKYKNLDDLIEFGWDKLNRDQQIGLKYYDELNTPIPRSEVAETEKIILDVANRIHPGFQICTVGGYRKGKELCGDMDFIISHPEEKLTQHFIGHLLDALVEDGWIRYELTVSFRNSERGQETLAWRGPNGSLQSAGQKKRAGFDTLDHAFIVWKNPNPHPVEGEQYLHRRVDIIISPWKTAGCAVLGWSGGRLFEQHLRSYVKNALGWKFDSSGVRHRGTGMWIDLESKEEDKGREHEVTLEEKERRVFEGLGLEYLKPTERCTL